MVDTTKYFTCNGAVDLLQRDPRTIGRALRGVRAEEIDPQGHERWKLPTIRKALEVHAGGPSGTGPLSGAADADPARLETEPDIARRREMLKEIGPRVGALDTAMRRANSQRPPVERGLLNEHCGRRVDETIGRIMALCGWNRIESEVVSSPSIF